MNGYEELLSKLPIDSEERREFEAWYASRPAAVQALVRKFPAGATVVRLEGVDHFVLGYTEDDKLIVSQVDPTSDYDRAMAEKVYVCAKHLEPAPTKDPS